MLAVLAALLMQASAPEAGSPAAISNPSWVRLPSAEFFQRYYPTDAAAKQIEGKATIDCVATVTGDLESCQVVEETPEGAGFGEAAMKLSLLFKMQPQTKSGQPVGGAHIRIPIRFKLPEAEAAPPTAPSLTASPPTLELAMTGPKAIKWLSTPGRDVFAITATRYVKGRSGSAVLYCIAAADGRFSGCKIESESAPDMGYGYGAMALARFYRMAPKTADGTPVAGGVVHVPIHFIAN